MTCLGILENLISDVLFVLGAILLGWAIYFVTRHTRLIRFFGVTESRRLTIYLSNLRVRTGGAIGIDGQPRSYQGSAVTFGEMQCANRFRDLFRYPLPSIADKPGILSKLLISDVQVELFRSPLTQEELERAASIITLGSPAYNVASRFVERELQSQFWFRTDSTDTSSSDNILAHAQVAGTGAFTTSGSTPDASVTLNPYFGDVGASDTIKSKPAIIGKNLPPFEDTSLGLVERIVDHERTRFVFYAAGLSELGTVGAAHYLATEWARLYRKYGSDRSFAVILKIEPTDYRKWSIVLEREQG